MTTFVLAIDQGTTNSKALLLDHSGTTVAHTAVPVPVYYPRPGWVEQSAVEIWETVRTAVGQCLARAGADPIIAAIGISNQRESVTLWNRRTGEPIGPCVTWQCRRSADRIDALRTPETERAVASRTGLGLDPLFPAAKIGWLLENYPEARAVLERGDLCAGTIDSWLIFKLTGGLLHLTDFSNASRTQLFDIHTKQWSDELCSLFGVPRAILPVVRSSDALFGTTTADSAPIPAGVSIHAAIGDSHAALFGHGIRTVGLVKATYGTGSSVMTLTDGPLVSRAGLSTTIAWQRGDRTAYALEGNISVSAQAASWVAKLLGLVDVDALTALAATVADVEGITIVPAFAGLGAPHWNDRARAVISGLTLSTTPAHVARATLEAIAMQIRDVFAAMEADVGVKLKLLSVDGGATRNDLLMQIQADLLGCPVQRHRTAELSAVGAGALASIACGFWQEIEATIFLSLEGELFAPQMDLDRRSAKVRVWNDAIRSAVANTRN